MSSIPPSGTLHDAMYAFFSVYSTDEQTRIWNNFVTQQGGTVDPTDPATIKAFYAYAQGAYMTIQKELSLSPEEIAKREIMFVVFELSFIMMKALQNSIAVTSQNLIFNGKWQEEYTNMLTKVPLYTSDPTQGMTINTADWSGTKFGYNDITMKDVAAYMTQYVQPGQVITDPTKTFQIAGSSIATWANVGYDWDVTGAWNGVVLAYNEDGTPITSDYTVFGQTWKEVASAGRITTSNFTPHLDFSIVVDPADSTKYKGVISIKAGTATQAATATLPFSTLSSDNKTITTTSKTFTYNNTALDDFNKPLLDANGNPILDANGNPTYEKLEVTFAIPADDPTDPDASYSAKTDAWTKAFGELMGNVYNPTTGQPSLFHFTTFTKHSDGTYSIRDATKPLSFSYYGARGLFITPKTDWLSDDTANSNALKSDFVIPWRYEEPYHTPDTSKTDQTTKNSQVQTQRGERNAVLQQVIENIRSKRQVVRDRATAYQETLSTTKEALSQQTNLLSSILDSMKGIIQAIFR